MAINVRCKACKADLKLSAKKCKCGVPIPQKGKIYRVIVRVNGKRVTRTVTNLELAKEIEGKYKVDAARDEHDLNKKIPAPTLKAIWTKFLPWAKEHKKSWKTDKYYYEKHLAPLFGSKQLDSISPFEVEKLILSLKKGLNKRGKPYSPATIKHQVVLLSRLYSIASQWGLYNGINPCNKLSLPKLNNQQTEFLSDDQLSRLLKVLEDWPNKRSSSLIKFALYTGLRRGEIFKLTWKDIDPNRKTILIRDPKGQIDQVLPLSDKAGQVLKDVPKEHESPYIFYGKNGGLRKDIKGPWGRIRTAAELPKDFRLHGLRHHFASALASNGVDLYIIQKLLTHKDASTTQRYAHLAEQTLRDAIKLSDSLHEKNGQTNIVHLRRENNG